MILNVELKSNNLPIYGFCSGRKFAFTGKCGNKNGRDTKIKS